MDMNYLTAAISQGINKADPLMHNHSDDLVTAAFVGVTAVWQEKLRP
ncbi:MAG: hypothetical protein GY796_11280 [Chloroflexi bacterium]|nr:hypothetical protein [Chloroflexota bacterium]